jgi:ammonia channel protein AmtB
VSESELANFIAAIASLIAALASGVGVLVSLINHRKIEEVHQATNGMKAELVKVTGEAKFAEGVVQGEKNIR